MQVSSSSINRLAAIIAFPAVLGIVGTFPWMITNLFSSTFLPHGFCFLWDRRLVWEHVVADLIIWLSYVVIAVCLARLVETCRQEIPFQKFFLAFGAFIIACGFTHLMAVVVLWKPLYWLEGDVKLVTAAASLVTALVLPLYLPRIRAFIHQAAASAKSERRFLAAANSSLDNFYLMDSVRDASGEIVDFQFTFANTNGATLMRCKPDQLIGQSLCKLVPFTRTEGFLEKFKRVVESGVPCVEEFRVRDDNIQAAWLKYQVVKLDDGIAITSSDITARKRLEFERSQAFTKSLIDSSPAAIIVTDLSHIISAVNPAAERILWYKSEELVGQATPLIFYDQREIEDRAKELSDRYGTAVSPDETVFFLGSARGEEDQAEWSFIRKGGTRVAVQVFVTPLIGDGADDSGFMITAYDISERKRREEYISHLSQHDSLTGLPTRNLLFDRLEMMLARGLRYGTRCALLMLDLDRFKDINDRFGHHAGDQALIQVAGRLRSAVRAVDTVARMGGDEFIVLLGDLRAPQDAGRVAEKLMAALSVPIPLHEEVSVSITASIGICMYPEGAMDGKALLRNADTAMYHAKSLSGHHIEFYNEEIARGTIRRQQLQAGLREALPNREFELHYQPQIDLSTREITGFESLLRWNSPRLGSIPPADFIPIAEKTGLIQPIGIWALTKACGDIRILRTSAIKPVFVSVNLSPVQIEQPNLFKIIENALKLNGIDPECLEVEITEGVLMQDFTKASRLLEGLRRLGVRIAIDDFGTGFSNMSYLLQLSVDCLKIDRSIIRDCPANGSSSAVTRAIIALAHQLGLLIVAEGVETREQAEFLKEEGCDRVQGFYFSKPLPLDLAVGLERSQFAKFAGLGAFKASP